MFCGRLNSQAIKFKNINIKHQVVMSNSELTGMHCYSFTLAGNSTDIFFVWPYEECDQLKSLFSQSFIFYTSHVMRKPVLAICKQQRCRSACASAQSDQHLCFSLLRIIPLVAVSKSSRL